MSVTVSGSSGLTKAYVSVLSTSGFAAVSGASRWLEALPADGPSSRPVPVTATPAATSAEPARRARWRRRVRDMGLLDDAVPEGAAATRHRTAAGLFSARPSTGDHRFTKVGKS